MLTCFNGIFHAEALQWATGNSGGPLNRCAARITRHLRNATIVTKLNQSTFEEAVWQSGLDAGLEMKSGGRGPVKSWSDHLAGFVSCRPQFNTSVMLAKSQLVRLKPAGIFNPVMFSWYICFFQFKWHACELARCS